MSETPILAPDANGPTICIGEILVEIMATTIGNGFLEAQPLTGPFPSGAPAIFIDQCGRFGGQAAMVGGVGDDDFGRVNTDRLRADGVDITGIHIDPVYPTGSAFVRYRADGNRDFIYNAGTSAAARIEWNDAVEAVVERAGHIHIMGLALSMPKVSEMIERAALRIKEKGGTLSLDPNLRKEIRYSDETEARFARLVELSDLLLPSGDEVERAAGITGHEAAIARLFARGVKEIAFKEGARGATVFTRDGASVHHPAFQVTEVDPTGAGDCFGAAYLTARRLGLGIEAALAYGCAAGARNVTRLGPMEGAGTRAELDRFMIETPKVA
ncbi:tagatose kinase [Gemmobacter serpentinus]|uniref:tagatose kinase n=1 Tax=Gemmobacter serpentinus TaxID=2652247 RepID=UPI00124BF5C7|nr:sugar kinase [Gemmobacter serpentinus]